MVHYVHLSESLQQCHSPFSEYQSGDDNRVKRGREALSRVETVVVVVVVVVPGKRSHLKAEGVFVPLRDAIKA